MKIENETQAKDTLKSAIQDVLSLPELSPPNNALAIDKIKKILEPAQAALAAYESREIELSENELTLLKFAKLSYHETIWAIKSLRAKSLVDGGSGDDKFAIDATDAGRAYLETRAQKRELRWEVWATESLIHGKSGALCCYCDNKDSADLIKQFFSNWRPSVAYEVREGK